MIIIKVLEFKRKNKNFIIKWLEKVLPIVSMIIILSTFTLCISLLLSSNIIKFDYNSIMKFNLYFYNSDLIILNLIPIIITFAILYIVFNRFYISWFVNNLIYLIPSYINKYSIIYRDKPLFPKDFKYIMEIKDVLINKNINITKYFIIIFIVIALISVFLKFLYDFKIKSYKKRGVILILLVFLSIFLYNNYYNLPLNLDKNILYTEKDNYINNGFIYSFITNTKDRKEYIPKKYNEDNVKKVLKNCKEDNLEEKFNIILIMVDGFNDFTKYKDIEIDSSIYKNYKEISKKSISGNISIDLKNKELLDVEREILTGYINNDDYDKKTNSFPWYFKNQGYFTEYMINENKLAYNRDVVNKLLGFNTNTQVENNFSSKRLIDSFKKIKNKSEYCFNISYINLDNLNIKDNNKINSNNKNISGENKIIFEEYLKKIKYIDSELKIIVDYFEEEELPTIILFSSVGGPILGKNNSVYEYLNINMDMNDKEGFKNSQELPYFFWGNSSLKDLFNKSFNKKGETISPNYLIPELLNYLDVRGSSYIQYLNDKKEIVSVLNNNFFLSEEGYLKRDENKYNYIEELYEEIMNVEYYYKNNFLY